MEHNTHRIIWGDDHLDVPQMTPRTFRLWCVGRGLPVVSVRTAADGTLVARDDIGHHIAECIRMRSN